LNFVYTSRSDEIRARFRSRDFPDLSPERYHPSPQAIPTWLAGQEHRLSESAFAEEGGYGDEREQV
jgi:hypothetical protein